MKYFIPYIMLCFVMAACSKLSDEQIIRNTISDMIRAVEEKERKTFVSYLDKDFRAQKTQRIADIQSMMFYHYQRNKNINIYVSDTEIRVDGKRADVILSVILTGAEGLLPKRVRAYRVEMMWRKLDDAWLVSRAHWEARDGP